MVSERRFALIIATDEYKDTDLIKLITPGQDAGALAKVLKNRDIGHFSVKILHNRSSHKVNEEIVKFFSTHERNDLLLLYISCHGIKDVDGQLYFATVNTRRKLLHATAISSDFINKEMFGSSSRKQILLLDCCYSGAFARGMRPRADNVINTKDYFEGGHGKVVITASDAMQYAFEEDKLNVEMGDRRSVFTRALVEGLETGKADQDNDGRISENELYDYIHDRVTNETPLQKPGKWSFGVQGELVVAQNPKHTAKVQPGVEPKTATPVEPKIVEPIVEPKTATPVEPKIVPVVGPKKKKTEPPKPRKRMPFIVTAIIGTIIVIGVLIYYIEQRLPLPPTSESDNHRPLAYNMDIRATDKGPVAFALNASDPDGDTVTYGIVANPALGKISSFDPSSGGGVYNPGDDITLSIYQEQDSFAFNAIDSNGAASSAATVTIKFPSGYG